MRAVRAGNGTVEVREVPAPAGSGVRVDVKAAGICGTDLHLISGADFPPPTITLGHEIAGITENGIAVVVHSLRRSAVRPDQRVAVIGAGTIGQWAAAAARGCEVGLVARHDAQRLAEERLGATEVTDGGYAAHEAFATAASRDQGAIEVVLEP